MRFRSNIVVIAITLILLSLYFSNIEYPVFQDVEAAEYKTPVGSNWTLDDIKTNAPEVVSESGGYYHVHENITVDFGATFTVEPGTRIKFHRLTSITVRGELIAKGTESDRIIATSEEAEPAARDWNGFIFEYRSTFNDRSVLEYMDISYSNNGVICRSAAPTISNVKISNCQNGIYGDSSSSPRVTNSDISDNNFWGIRLSKADTEISNTTLSSNYYGIFAMDSSLRLIDNTIDNNTLYGVLHRGGNSVLKRNKIISNGQSFSGLYPGAKFDDSTITLESNRFEFNTHAGMELVNSTAYSHGDAYSGNLIGINITDGTRLYADNIDISNSIEHGLKVVNASIELINSTIALNGWGPAFAGPFFTGVFISKGYGNLERNHINENGFMGIAIENSYAELENNFIQSNNKDGIYCWYSSPLIKNTTTYTNERYEIFVDSGSHPKLINFFGNESKINIFGESSSISFGFTVVAYIVDNDGNPVNNANLEFIDKSIEVDTGNIITTSGVSIDGETPPVTIYYKKLYHNNSETFFNFSNVTQDGIFWGLTATALKEGGFFSRGIPIETAYPRNLGFILSKIPKINITTSPSKFSGVIKGTLTLEGVAWHDHHPIETVYYQVDTRDWLGGELNLKGELSTGWKLELDTNTLISGEHSIHIKAFDGYTYSTQLELSINVDNPLGETDSDNDKLTYVEEIMLGTDPEDPDSDSDGLPDGIEVDDSDGNTTDPLDSDSDSDGLSDGDEDKNGNGRVEPTETDPNDPDTDSDTISDSEDAFPLDGRRWRNNNVESDDIYLVFSISMVVIIIIVGILMVIVFKKTAGLKKEHEDEKAEAKKSRKPST